MARVIFLAPVIQLLALGYAVNTDVHHAPMIVLDEDRTEASRRLVEEMTGSGYFEVERAARRPADLARALDHGEALLALHIPRGFSRDLLRPSGASVQVLVDGTSSNTANVAQSYASRMIQDFGLRQGGLAVAGGINFLPRVWYNPDLSSRVYNVPAVAAVIIFLMCLLLTSLGVVREREIGTLDQLMVSPLRPVELMLGKTLPVVLVALIDLLLVTAVSLLWFGIPMRGSFGLLLGSSLVFILAGLGLGLLISTISNTQQEAYMTMFLIFLPAMLFSGFMFPITSMPVPVQWLTLANPLRYFLEVVRGVFLNGTGLTTLWPQIAVLAAMATVLMTLAVWRFKGTER
ncbi:MAG: ABC transporter permease [Gemmatimonadales bacterium]